MSKAKNLVHAGRFKYAWAEEMASIAKSDFIERETNILIPIVDLPFVALRN